MRYGDAVEILKMVGDARFGPEPMPDEKKIAEAIQIIGNATTAQGCPEYALHAAVWWTANHDMKPKNIYVVAADDYRGDGPAALAATADVCRATKLATLYGGRVEMCVDDLPLDRKLYKVWKRGTGKICACEAPELSACARDAVWVDMDSGCDTVLLLAELSDEAKLKAAGMFEWFDKCRKEEANRKMKERMAENL